VPSKVAIFIVALLEFLPPKLIALFMDYAPFKALQNARRVHGITVGIAKGLVEEKAEALIAGKGKRDVMSLLGSWQEFMYMSFRLTVKFQVRANASADPHMNLSNAEMFAQMQ
jgi:hypothetical protein